MATTMSFFTNLMIDENDILNDIRKWALATTANETTIKRIKIAVGSAANATVKKATTMRADNGIKGRG